MKTMKLTEKQVRKNRAGIKAMWKRIPSKWIYLDAFLFSQQINLRSQTRQYSREELAKKCDGPDGPKNPCGAVGCFAGWGWTYHPYQTWCSRNKLAVSSTTNLGVWLGLHNGKHELFTSRLNAGSQTQRQEVQGRIKSMMFMDVHWLYQEVEPK